MFLKNKIIEEQLKTKLTCAYSQMLTASSMLYTFLQTVEATYVYFKQYLYYLHLLERQRKTKTINRDYSHVVWPDVLDST